MITAKDFKDYLKSKIKSPQWFSNTVGDGTKEESITVYDYKGSTPYTRAIGNTKIRKYKGFQILVRWGTQSEQAMLKAQELYEILDNIRTVTINNITIKDTIMQSGAPVFLGTDDRGILEYVINLFILEER